VGTAIKPRVLKIPGFRWSDSATLTQSQERACCTACSAAIPHSGFGRKLSASFTIFLSRKSSWYLARTDFCLVVCLGFKFRRWLMPICLTTAGKGSMTTVSGRACRPESADGASVELKKPPNSAAFLVQISLDDQTRRTASLCFLRNVIKPMPAKPMTIMAQVEGSGTALIVKSNSDSTEYRSAKKISS